MKVIPANAARNGRTLSWWDESISYGDLASARARAEVWRDLVRSGEDRKKVTVAVTTRRGLRGTLQVETQLRFPRLVPLKAQS